MRGERDGKERRSEKSNSERETKKEREEKMTYLTNILNGNALESSLSLHTVYISIYICNA